MGALIIVMAHQYGDRLSQEMNPFMFQLIDSLFSIFKIEKNIT